ncbi:dihydropyrimidinase [Thermosipho melanesiensis]|uniref:Dihydropyrimidinase n=2 Tax=Thermosipho melanesiensis TaxID=46541 RepID=A6LJ95_THEM4|nr:amidohydrolase family protein [Thermosipho melanesiensis]ABR29996.1 Dihydropyrimidinase [Thermosipho melanesiensis BI429]APT73200.1 dihydropyrimidinase [Thermosipho melanesiensis]OOC38594.1 dihydropyrimidinase [Thermosipho melanesiensis]OOC40398.1 dihydropyrimidinase [Thermosipho melanesiensis]OOC40662.1 dihydropyrimidinase [Thermosipho melanesiensis]
MYDVGIINGKVYLGDFIYANVYIKSGKIYDITTSYKGCKKEYNANENLVLPGFIDPHVHFELNFGKHTSVDDFESGSISAIYGGITTIIDFLDPISHINELDKNFEKRLNLAKKSYIDFSFHVTLGNFKDNIDELLKKTKKLGTSSIKIFTTYSSSNRRTNDKIMYKLLQKSNEYKVPILIHAENDDMISENVLIKDHENARPAISEITEITKILEMVNMTNGISYIVHTTCGTSIEETRKRFPEIINKNIYFESCPHYFYFSNDVYKEKHGFLYTMTPPLRSNEEKEKLRKNIDYIFSIGTDHCSFNKEDKDKKTTKDLPMGIGGVEHSFVLMYSLFGEKIIDKFTTNPAKFFGLFPQKGSLLPGATADVVIFSPNQYEKITRSHSKANYDIYLNMQVKGKIQKVFKSGILVLDHTLIRKTKGKYLRRL